MKKIKPKEPKPLVLVFTALSGIVLGGALGVWILVTKPVTVASKMPDESILSQPGNYRTFYVPGAVASAQSANLRSGVSRIQRRNPGPISFSEDEVNYFFQSLKEPSKEAKAEEEKEAEESPVAFKGFNVRISGDQMVASVRVISQSAGSPFEMMLQANIGFENLESGPELVINSLRVNSLPVPTLGGVFESMIESKIAEAEWNEDLIEMWQNIRKIEIESDKLITEVGLRRA